MKVGESKDKTGEYAPEFRLFKPAFFLYSALKLFGEGDGAILVEDDEFEQFLLGVEIDEGDELFVVEFFLVV